MALRERLESWVGVWEGTYTQFTPVGARVDQFASRQETRLEGDRWFERILYRWPDGREQQLDFRARLIGECLTFDDANFQAETYLVTDSILVFPYHWKDRPDENIVETIVFPTPDRKVRLWQKFECDELVQLTSIVEQRKPEETPDVWT